MRWPLTVQPDGRTNIVTLIRFGKVVVWVDNVNDLIASPIQRSWQIENVLRAPLVFPQLTESRGGAASLNRFASTEFWLSSTRVATMGAVGVSWSTRTASAAQRPKIGL